ncbi:MAG: hypothetical protein ABSE81_02595 [Candidatus Omnitrophota bacterium]|jgi:hypothetical protein
MEDKKDLNNLRDCVKICFEQGAKRGNEFRKMSFAIIVELKRIGFSSSEVKDKLLEWNQRCEKPLAYNEQKRQLLDFVEWTDKHECNIGCKALESYCIEPEEKCTFRILKECSYKQSTQENPFDFEEARHFLEARYKGPDGYVMYWILKNIRRFQLEKQTGEIIYIGYRKIAAMIRDNDGQRIEPMTIVRRIEDLISEGMLQKVVKGKRGTFSGKANGYRFLCWKTPVTPNPATQ